MIRLVTAKSAGKNLKPYQGLKLTQKPLVSSESKAGKNLKPYQGLKTMEVTTKRDGSGRKKPKTLSGIETANWRAILPAVTGRKKPKTLSGIETKSRP